MPLQAQVCHPTFAFDQVDLPYQHNMFDFETARRYQTAGDFASLKKAVDKANEKQAVL